MFLLFLFILVHFYNSFFHKAAFSIVASPIKAEQNTRLQPILVLIFYYSTCTITYVHTYSRKKSLEQSAALIDGIVRKMSRAEC